MTYFHNLELTRNTSGKFSTLSSGHFFMADAMQKTRRLFILGCALYPEALMGTVQKSKSGHFLY